MWRNWQTRRFQVPVGDHAGSSPVIRTKKENQSEHFFIICSDWFFVSFYIILLLPAMPLNLPLAW